MKHDRKPISNRGRLYRARKGDVLIFNNLSAKQAQTIRCRMPGLEIRTRELIAVSPLAKDGDPVTRLTEVTILEEAHEITK